MHPAPRYEIFTQCRILRMGLLLVLVTAGCRAPLPDPEDEKSYVWPPPPAQPRIAYEKSIMKPSDFGIRRNWWKRLGGYIVGHSGHDLAFSKPTGICLDESGNLCVTDTGTKSVWFFDLDRKRSGAEPYLYGSGNVHGYIDARGRGRRG